MSGMGRDEGNGGGAAPQHQSSSPVQPLAGDVTQATLLIFSESPSSSSQTLNSLSSQGRLGSGRCQGKPCRGPFVPWDGRIRARPGRLEVEADSWTGCSVLKLGVWGEL